MLAGSSDFSSEAFSPSRCWEPVQGIKAEVTG